MRDLPGFLNSYGCVDVLYRRDAIKTDQLKLELMRAKAGEINTFLQKQILEKQARQEQERTRRINTPDVFARTGYPPVNSPSRDLKAMEVARTQKSTLNPALTSNPQGGCARSPSNAHDSPTYCPPPPMVVPPDFTTGNRMYLSRGPDSRTPEQRLYIWPE